MVAMPAPTASATAATGRGLLMPSPRLSPRLRPMPLFCTEATATAMPLPTPTAATAMPPPMPTAPMLAPTTMVPALTAMASATGVPMVATGRGLLMPSPRLRLMLLFCMEATATATPLPSPTGATPTLPTPTAPTPTPTPMAATAPTATASATAVSATATPGNSLHPHYVHIRGHHVRAGCLGVGFQQAAWAKI